MGFFNRVHSVLAGYEEFGETKQNIICINFEIIFKYVSTLNSNGSNAKNNELGTLVMWTCCFSEEVLCILIS